MIRLLISRVIGIFSTTWPMYSASIKESFGASPEAPEQRIIGKSHHQAAALPLGTHRSLITDFVLLFGADKPGHQGFIGVPHRHGCSVRACLLT